MGISKIKILGFTVAIIAISSAMFMLFHNRVSNGTDLGITIEEFQNSYNNSWWYDSPNIIKVSNDLESMPIYLLDNKVSVFAFADSNGTIIGVTIVSYECSSFEELNETLQKTLYILGKDSVLDSFGISNFLKHTIEGNYTTITDCIIEKSITGITDDKTFSIHITPRFYE